MLMLPEAIVHTHPPRLCTVLQTTFAAVLATIIETSLLQIGMRSGFQNVRLVVAQMCGSKQETSVVSPERVSSSAGDDKTEKKTD